MYSFDKYVKLCHELQDKKPTPVAEAAGVQRSLISRWKGGGGITDTSALKLAKYLGVPIEALKEEKKENPAATNGNEALEEKGYYKLNKENKKLIDQMIAQLIKSQSGD